MARVIQGGISTHVEVAFCGEHLIVWEFPNSYMVFYGDQSLEITEPEASFLGADLVSLSSKLFELKWKKIIEQFLKNLS
jgi:hypothetical protein